MSEQLLHLVIATRSLPAVLRDRLAEDAGEGVISAAIAVLVMAFLGVAMWGLFEVLLTDASGQIGDTIEQIGG